LDKEKDGEASVGIWEFPSYCVCFMAQAISKGLPNFMLKPVRRSFGVKKRSKIKKSIRPILCVVWYHSLAESLVLSHTAALLIAQERRDMQVRLEAIHSPRALLRGNLGTVILNVLKEPKWKSEFSFDRAIALSRLCGVEPCSDCDDNI